MCSRGNLTGTCAYGEERSALWMDLLRLHSHGCLWCLTCLTEFFMRPTLYYVTGMGNCSLCRTTGRSVLESPTHNPSHKNYVLSDLPRTLAVPAVF